MTTEHLRDLGVDTWGLRWRQEALRLSAWLFPTLRWLHAVQPVLERISSQLVPNAGRYRRIEAPLLAAPLGSEQGWQAETGWGTGASGAFLFTSAPTSEVGAMGSEKSPATSVDTHLAIPPMLGLGITTRPLPSSNLKTESSGSDCLSAAEHPFPLPSMVFPQQQRSSTTDDSGEFKNCGLTSDKPGTQQPQALIRADLSAQVERNFIAQSRTPFPAASIDATSFAGTMSREMTLPHPRPGDKFGASADPAWRRGEDGQTVPPEFSGRLRDQLGPWTENIRLHINERATRWAREAGADAFAVGHDVVVRQDRYDPASPRGFALLLHEALHVSEAMHPSASWRRATRQGLEEEETRALDIERRALSPFVPGGRNISRSAPTASPMVQIANSSLAVPHRVPMAAASDRALFPIEPTGADFPSNAAHTNTEEMRQQLFRDLMHQIRIEFERGG